MVKYIKLWTLVSEYNAENYYKQSNIYHIYQIKQCPMCGEKYPELEYKYCPKCSNELIRVNIGQAEELKTGREICYCCGHEKPLDSLRLYCGERNDNFTEWETNGNCWIQVCSDCAPKCQTCGKFIKTPQLSKILEEKGNICEHNPCNSCLSVQFCKCEHPIALDKYEKPTHIPQKIIDNIETIYETQKKFCINCQTLIQTHYKYCPYCGKEAIKITEIKKDNYQTFCTSNEYKCDICGESATLKIKLFGGERIDYNKKIVYCNCELHLCNQCTTICNDCGKIILTNEIKQYLTSLGKNCKLNPCEYCLSLAFCNCKYSNENKQKDKSPTQPESFSENNTIEESILTNTNLIKDMKYCTKCKQVTEDPIALYCTKCGTPLEKIKQIQEKRNETNKSSTIYQQIKSEEKIEIDSNLSFYQKGLMLTQSLTIIGGVITFVTICILRRFEILFSIFIYLLTSSIIINGFFNPLSNIQINLSILLYKNKYTRLFSYLILFICSIFISLLISGYSILTLIIVSNYKITYILIYLTSYFIAIFPFFRGIYTIPHQISWLCSLLLGIIFNLSSYQLLAIMTTLMIIPVFYINYSILINKEDNL